MPARRHVKQHTHIVSRGSLSLTCDLEKRVPLIRRHVLQAFQSQQKQDDLGLIFLLLVPLIDVLAERKLAIWAPTGLDPRDWIVFVAHLIQGGQAAFFYFDFIKPHLK